MAAPISQAPERKLSERLAEDFDPDLKSCCGESLDTLLRSKHHSLHWIMFSFGSLVFVQQLLLFFSLVGEFASFHSKMNQSLNCLSVYSWLLCHNQCKGLTVS